MIPWEWWGSGVPYAAAWARQQARREQVQSGGGGEVLALLSHRPVVTFGRREAPGNPSDEALNRLGLDVYHTERGGLATWHGPGQLVGYLICDLPKRRLRVRKVVEALEQGLGDWIGGFGLRASTRAGYPGVWLGSDKICAIGLSVQHGVTIHGFAMNLRADTASYAHILPCGITDGGVTSLHLHRPDDAPEPLSAAPSVARSVLAALESAVGA